ncbi:MAG: sulfite exporter TauE/SafE family protein [Chlorobiota bacterium]|nr:MAG: sulfite exporter TauE/SafE family protein [Chlorobiota bacterium]
MILAGFILGITVSLHCAGMCGPLVLFLNAGESNIYKMMSRNLFYGLGKTITYAFLGGLVGLFGMSLNLIGLQQIMSLITGVLLLLYAIVQTKKLNLPKLEIVEKFNSKIVRLITIFKVKKKITGPFYFGLLNGFLPCGVIYIALAMALNGANPYVSAGYMAAFGLGTLIMLFTISFSGNFIRSKFQPYIPLISRTVTIFISILLIIRGLGLGIPYLSPKLVLNANNESVLDCCRNKLELK